VAYGLLIDFSNEARQGFEKRKERKEKQEMIQNPELQEMFAETDRKIRETSAQIQETDRILKRQMADLNKQIGGLGNKFGRFTEGLLTPSLEKLLYRRFKVESVFCNMRNRLDGGDHIQLDVFGVSRRRKEAFVVEIKNSLGEDELQQTLGILEAFPRHFPEFHDYKLFGVIAAVDIPEAMRNRTLKAGIWIVRASNALCKVDVPPGFQPKLFHAPAEV
jgi:hypothetical protein